VRTRKVTVHVDADLLRRAQRRTGQGVPAAIRDGLELVAASDAGEKIRASIAGLKLVTVPRR
jgi:hypothetical protein